MTFRSLFLPHLTRRLNYPHYRKYSQYREEIRQDCKGRCVYCDVHENELGGADQMTIDHFRPKSIDEFKHLQHEPTNLVWACRICNENKQSKWPAIGTSQTYVKDQGFIDPFIEDRNLFFDVTITGEFVALANPARWMIARLRLNRSNVQRIRRKRIESYKLCENASIYCLQIESQYKAKAIIVADDPAAQAIVEELAAILEETRALIVQLAFDDTLY